MEMTKGSFYEDRSIEINLKDRDDNDWKKNEQTLRNPWGNIKMSNIGIIGVPEGKERQNWAEKIYIKYSDQKFPRQL